MWILGIYLDFSCIPLLLSLSRRIHVAPAASWATGSPTHLCLPPVSSARGSGEETRVFLLHFPAGDLSCFCKPRHTELPQDAAERLNGHSHEVSSEGEMRLVAKAGISGSWVCVTWAAHPGLSAEHFCFPTTPWGWQRAVYECQSCAAVIHTYCICYMQVENIKLGCFWSS